MGETPALEPSVLHRREQILQPPVLAGVELVPERHRGDPAEHEIANPVEGADEFVGPFELRQVEFEPRRFAKDLFASCLTPNDLPAPGGPNTPIDSGFSAFFLAS